jgi:hypothetical protein
MYLGAFAVDSVEASAAATLDALLPGPMAKKTTTRARLAGEFYVSTDARNAGVSSVVLHGLLEMKRSSVGSCPTP